MPQSNELSRLPSLRRDISVLVKETIEVGTILDAIRDMRSREIERVDVFDVFRGNELPNGRKSVAILVVMRDTERTLTDSDGDRIVEAILAMLARRFDATLRSQTAP